MKRIIFLFTLAICAVTASALQPQRGYRGFVDWNNFLDLNFGFIAGDPGDSKVITGFTTSHGYQFNNWLYVGGGVGFMYNLDWKAYNNSYDEHYVVPVFVEGRLDAKWGRFTPYFSVQLGANVIDGGGIYFAPMVGYRFNWGRRSAINFGLGATLYGRVYKYQDYVPGPNGGLIEGPIEEYRGWPTTKFTARLGFEFQLP